MSEVEIAIVEQYKRGVPIQEIADTIAEQFGYLRILDPVHFVEEVIKANL